MPYTIPHTLLSAVIFGAASIPLPLLAQEVVPDGTLGPEPSIVTEVNATTDLIEGGALRNATLFHSFSEFGIADGHRVDFANPTGVNTIFSRVTGNNPSLLFGTLGVLGDADLVFLNPNGVLFGPNAQLDLNGAFTVSTATSIAFPGGETFDVGNPGPVPLLTINVQAPVGLVFEGADPGAIINQGTLAVDAGEGITLIGGTLSNSGTLLAPGGQISVASVPGNYWIGLEDDGTINGRSALTDVALTGGGLSVAALAMAGGIDLADLPAEASVFESGTAVVGGQLDAASEQGQGGTVQVFGDRVALTNATVEASGATGGGTVLVGGDYQGQGDLPTASRTFIGSAAVIRADALEAGDGGRVIAWADGDTIFSGTISAQGGATLGNGGFVEVSGHEELRFRGFVNTRAPNGEAGTVLLDPRDIRIVDGSGGDDDNEIGRSIISFTPFLIDAAINAVNDPNADFTISETILEGLSTYSRRIILQANRDIIIEDLSDNNLAFDFPLYSGTSATFQADFDNNGEGSFSMNQGDQINTLGMDLNIYGDEVSIGSINTIFIDETRGSGDIRIEASGNITATNLESGALATSSVNSTVDAGNINITSRNGSIDISNSGRVISGSYGGRGGYINIEAYGNITTGNLVSSGNLVSGDYNGGNITIDSRNGSVNTSAGEVFSAGRNDGGNISIEAYGNIITDDVRSYQSDTNNAGTIDIVSNNGSIDTRSGSVLAGPGNGINQQGREHVNIEADGNIALGRVVAGSIEVETDNGAISSNDFLNISGDATFTSGAGNSGTVHVNNTSTSIIGTSTIGGNLEVTSNGAVSQAIGETLQVAGTIDVNGAGSGPLINNAVVNPSQTTTDPNTGDTIITQIGAVEIPEGTYSGDLTVTSLDFNGTTFSQVLTDNAIVLDQDNSFGGTLRFSTGVDNLITGSTLGITQAGSIEVAGNLTLQAGSTGNITLDEIDNQFSQVSFQGDNVALTSQDGLILQTSTAEGDLTLVTEGTITQTGDVSVGGDTTLTVNLPQAGNVTLDNQLETVLGESVIGGTLTLLGDSSSQVNGESVQAPAIVQPAGTTSLDTSNSALQISGNDVVITDVGNIDLAVNIPGSVTINSENLSTTIPYEGALTVNSLASGTGFNSYNTLAINLSDGDNAFTGAIRITTDADTSTTPFLATPGITQSGTNPLVVNDQATFSAIGGDIALANPANRFNAIQFEGRNVALSEADSTTLLAGIATGEFALSSGGDITQTDGLLVGGTSRIESRQPDANIALLNQANQLLGEITFVTEGSGIVLLINALSDTILAETTLGGDFGIWSGGSISQTGAITVAGDALFIYGSADSSNSLQLNNSSNDFNRIFINDPALITNTSPSRGGNVDLVDINGLIMGNSSSYGDVTINAGGDFTAIGDFRVIGDFTLNATGDISTRFIDTTFGFANGNISLTSETGSIDTTRGELITSTIFTSATPQPWLPPRKGGDVEITAPGDLRLGYVIANGYPNGNITLATDSNIFLEDGIYIESSNYGDITGGVALPGDITVARADTIYITNGANIEAAVFGNADGGNILIENTRRLIIEGNATDETLISTYIGDDGNGNIGTGNGGTISLNVSESIDIIGANPNSLVTDPLALRDIIVDAATQSTGVTTSTFTSGRSGDLTVTTNQLRISNEAGIITGSYGVGEGGTLTVNAQRSELNGGGIVSTTVGAGDAGSLIFNGGQISLVNGSIISTDSLSASNMASAGDIRFNNVDEISLNTRGRISTSSFVNNGGNIFLENISLIRLNGGEGVGGIFTDAGVLNASGDGGRIFITADNILANPWSNTDISAGAYLGAGGGIEVSARYISGIGFRSQPTLLSDITAPSQFGAQGTVNIQDENLDPTQGIDALPVEPRGPEAIQSCQLGNSPSATFFDHGRGGLLPRPEDLLTVDSILVEWLSLELAEGSNVASAVPVSEEPQLLAACGVDEGV